jgi:hypothetical protein
MAKASNTQPVPTPATVSHETILIIRKATGRKVPTLTKAKREAIAEALRTSRVERPEILAYFLSGDFAASEAVSQVCIDNPLHRRKDHAEAGWTVPESSLGRAPKSGKRDYQSTAQSVLLWLKRVFVDTGWLTVEHLSVIVDTAE